MASKKLILLLAVLGAVFASDQATKRYVSSSFQLHESREIIPDFFHITYIHNKGAAFGFMADADSPWVAPFFVCITLAATGILLWMYWQAPPKKKFFLVGISLLLGGAFGNFADRLMLGEVVDFLDFHFYAHHWPAFNIADSAITVGVCLFLIDIITSR
ncbi:MAG: signal peptidase II [Nitrospinae bacterium]|nr:signal peptidase II [Nitrospinota bacterium]